MKAKMKSLAFVVSVILFVTALACSAALAKDKEIPLTATASSSYRDLAYYSADRAVDGNPSTRWYGGMDQSPWTITFYAGGEAGKDVLVKSVHIVWNSFSDYYVPTSYTMDVSSDGASWAPVSVVPPEGAGSQGETIEINQEIQYIKITINSVNQRFPTLEEFTAYKEINIPRLVRFQGTLGNAEGIPLDGTYDITFRLYDAPEPGTTTALWEEVREGTQAVYVKDGLLDVELGSVTELDLPFDKQYWLGIQISPDDEMTPRFKLTSVPYALVAEE